MASASWPLDAFRSAGRSVLTQSGLDAWRILARIQDHHVTDARLANTEASVARGTFGSPTFFVGDEMFFGRDRLRDVEERIIAQGKT